MAENNTLEKDCKRTVFAPLQCRVLEPNTKTPHKLNKKVYYLSPLEAENIRLRRAKEFGLTPPSKDSFLHNQSYPCLHKSPENAFHSINVGSMHRCSIDKFKGDELNTICFSPMKNFDRVKNEFNDRNLDRSWMLYKYIAINSGNHILHSFDYPKKAIVTINPCTNEILMLNKAARNLLEIEENETNLKLNDFIYCVCDRYLFVDAIKSNGEVVLFSGKILRLLTRSKKMANVSVWAKALSTEPDPRCLVIMEVVELKLGTVWFDSEMKIFHCDDNFANIFCYEDHEKLVNINMKEFIPSFDLDQENYRDNLNPEGKLSLCVTGKTKDNFNFPINMDVSQCSRKDISLEKESGFLTPIYEGNIMVYSDISGLITIFSNGMIHSLNANFSMLLFGYLKSELIGKDISTLIPNFHEDVDYYDTNSVALPSFDDDDEDSKVKCENSDGRNTANSFINELSRPSNPLSNPLCDKEFNDAFIQSKEVLSSPKHSSNCEVSSENKASFLPPYSNEIHPYSCDINKQAEISTSFKNGDSSQLQYYSPKGTFQDSLHLDTNSNTKSDMNANVVELLESDNDNESSHQRYTSSEKEDSDSFESESECDGCDDDDSEKDNSEDDSGSDKENDNETSSSQDDDSDDVSKLKVCSPLKTCKLRATSPMKRLSPCNYLGTSTYRLKNSTPKQSSCNTSKSSYDESYLCYREGLYQGIGQHKDGTNLAVEYYIKKIVLDSGEILYCLWLSRNPEEIKEGSPSKINENQQSENDTSKTSLSDPERSESSLSTMSELSIEEALEGPFSEHYTFLKDLTKGAFGSVKQAYRNSDGLLVITKVMKKSEVHKNSWIYNCNLNKEVPFEVHLLYTINHPNIVKVLDIFENKKCFQIVMEKHGCGMDLFEFIERKPYMDEELCSYIFRQIVSALSYLHSRKILHRDIKDENIIINEKFHAKLIDFGAAAYMEEGKLFTSFAGTTEYCSPEVLRGEKHCGPELEMFALGVTLYTLVFLQNPFLNADEILKGEYTFDYEISASLYNLIEGMLRPNPTKRFTLSDVENNEWVNQPVLIEKYKFADVISNAKMFEIHPVRYKDEVSDIYEICRLEARRNDSSESESEENLESNKSTKESSKAESLDLEERLAEIDLNDDTDEE